MTSNDQPDLTSQPSSTDEHLPSRSSPAGRIPDALPIDSDVDSFRPSAGSDFSSSGQNSSTERAAHHQLELIGLVFIGGFFGTLSRYGLTYLLGSPDGFPVSTLVENVTGAFLLGVLLEGLSRRDPDRGKRRHLRLLLGTGFLGGFTTYSSFAVDAVHLAGAGETYGAIMYVALTILLGAAASFAGIWCASTQYQRRHEHARELNLEPLTPADQRSNPASDAASHKQPERSAPGHLPVNTDWRAP
ncbi:protein CrcB [Arthrobacter sp. CAN_A2]|uniref:fluoride efflux transporter FluC n=1 Tax=Arthrobacter sp. CAN_A2 TaxID=2787718 RepID=UPI001A27E2E8